MSQQALIQLKNIIKTYPQTVALNDVSLEFYPGEIHAVVGENGAGKSTLMNIIAGLCRPDSGSVCFDGRNMPVWNPELARRYGIAMVHQHFTLIPEMTVAENILLAGGRWTSFLLQKKVAEREIIRLCRSYGLDLNPRTRAGKLSPGQKQRAEIIKALYYQCKVLILDEPTAVLTGDETQRLFSVLRQLAGSGTAVLLISHKLDEVFDISSRITILRQGKAAGSTRPGEMTVRQVAQLMISGVENEMSYNAGVRPSGSRLSGGRLFGVQPPDAQPPGVQPPDAQLNGVGQPVKAAGGTFEDAAAASVEDVSGTPVVNFAERFGAGYALEIRNLYAVGPDGRSGVNGVSLAVDRGRIYGVAGVDGNGQSTLAAAVMGLIPKLDKASWERLKAKPGGRLRIGGGASDLRGILFINGEDFTCAFPETILEKPFGYIPEDCQETGIVSEMTLEENLILNSFSREKYGRGPFMDWGNVRREAVRAMCDMDIRAFSGKQTAGTLSGGNQQKLVVARELGKRPEILLAVNPTRGIDANAAQKIHSLFLQARADGCAILLISTDLDEILYLSDRIGVMYEGRLAAEFDGLLSASKDGDTSVVENEASEAENKSAAENKSTAENKSATENKSIAENKSTAENKESAVKNRGILREQLLRRQIGLAMAGHRLQDAGGDAV